MYAAVSRDPFHFDAFSNGAQWAANELPDTAHAATSEAVMTDVVQRMATPGGRFDYDLVAYTVTPHRGPSNNTYANAETDGRVCARLGSLRAVLRSVVGPDYGVYWVARGGATAPGGRTARFITVLVSTGAASGWALGLGSVGAGAAGMGITAVAGTIRVTSTAAARSCAGRGSFRQSAM